MSILMRAPELQLSNEEARQYAEGVAAVARHYDVGASALTLDWLNLGTTMASIYGMRIMSIKMRRSRGGPDEQPPFANGHDAAPPSDDSGGVVVDFSLMTGGAARERPN